ncbi:MAG: vitamin B12-dependent ribonucleotide reductase, partial [Planctomycetes bacterium]|nr:vitamin B12-dependent ribonucleotide reductase [Planctomycetota bacterium]
MNPKYGARSSGPRRRTLQFRPIASAAIPASVAPPVERRLRAAPCAPRARRRERSPRQDTAPVWVRRCAAHAPSTADGGARSRLGECLRALVHALAGLVLRCPRRTGAHVAGCPYDSSSDSAAHRYTPPSTRSGLGWRSILGGHVKSKTQGAVKASRTRKPSERPANASASTRSGLEGQSLERPGLEIPRRFSRAGADPYACVEWRQSDSQIKNTDGSVVAETRGVEVPAKWSQVAVDIMVSKYFRRAGVPQLDAAGQPLRDAKGQPVLGGERSVKQVVHRLTHCWRNWGERYGYFRTGDDAQTFQDELAVMLLRQMAAPNSPQWFNTGLYDEYGISGPPQGHYYVDPADEKLKEAENAYARPQPHACFIQSVADTLVGEGGIMDLWTREARLFKFGSGTGTNFSSIRGEGETLAGGGVSSGLMSFLKIGDRAAGAIKSGGTTRRAAKMVCLDVDHPDIEEFVMWKAKEETKAHVLIDAGFSSDFEGEAYRTVSGQNSNNSIRVPEAFLQAVVEDGTWDLTRRTDGIVSKTIRARELWEKICDAAWRCADPGVQFDTTINDWHTCPNDGPIRASNPCSEYMFLDDTACNLASLNLTEFFDRETLRFDIEGFRHAVRLWTVVLEISVLMASYPSEAIARKSYEYRTLGLGYANIGSLLMISGVPYDSDKARAITGAITAILTGESYAASAEMAGVLGPFPRYLQNKESMLRVMRNHRRAAYHAAGEEYEGLHQLPMGIDPELCPADLLAASRTAWDRALELGERHGYRNAQTTVIAPTGTIGLLMDCDTTGIEPDFALVKFKKLAGGGYFKIANQSLEPALRTLGYSAEQIQEMLRYVLGTMTFEGAPEVNRASLKERGLLDTEIARIEKALPGVFELRSAVHVGALEKDGLQRLGLQHP